MHDLQKLGPLAFQDLAAALTFSAFGPGVQKMGSGRDGGRDLYYEGALTWSLGATTPAEIWHGYTVFQVKHKATLAALPSDNASWLWGEVRKELVAWAESEKDRARVPDHFVIVTNVPLTPTPKTGGHDSLLASIAAHIARLGDSRYDAGEGVARRRQHARLSSIKSWRVWDGNQISGLIDAYPQVRRAFSGFLTASDVFANLADFTDQLPLSDLEPALRTHARAALSADGQIHFDEGGSSDVAAFPLHDVAVDLPVVVPNHDEPQRAIGLLLDRAEHVLKPNLGSYSDRRHLVLTGSPGNGKTTLARLLVQAFRCSLLAGGESLSRDQKRIIEGTRAAMGRLGRDLPRHRRWPLRVDLAEYAQDAVLDLDTSLIDWITRKVSRQSTAGNIRSSFLLSWLRQWPSFFVLDGLDEVTEPTLRKRLIAVITQFVNELEAEACDAFVVVTTRPMGYTENIAPNYFERVDLSSLPIDEARRYGELVIATRLPRGSERADHVRRRFLDATRQEALRNLMRTPLQVLILTIILDAGGQLPPDRYSLFWDYYQTVYRRERNKVGGLNRLLSDHAQQIRKLHERVGFELQLRSESTNRSTATLTERELRDTVWQLLKDDGFLPDDRDSTLLDEMLTAATQRLVLITPHGSDGYGFDVRSLQELSAAMYLTSGTDDQVIARLRAAAPSPHWRNTWLFAAGSLFALPRTHHHEGIVQLLETIDAEADKRLGKIIPVGPLLALDVLDDGMARSMPRHRDKIAAVAFGVLQEPRDVEVLEITRMLVRYADNSEETQAQVAHALRAALSARQDMLGTAKRVQLLVVPVVKELNARERTRGLAKVLSNPGPGRAILADPWGDFELEVATAPLDANNSALLARAAEGIRVLRYEEQEEEDYDTYDAAVAAVQAGLDVPAVASALNSALEHVAASDSELVLSLRTRLLTVLSRKPIGPELR